jgi:hypothetical protein
MSVSPPPTYPAAIEQAIAEISRHLRGDYPLSHRTLALLLLQDDPEIWEEVAAQESHATLNTIRAVKEQLERVGETPLSMANRTSPPTVEPATRGAGDAGNHPAAPQHPRRVGRLAVHEPVDGLPHPRCWCFTSGCTSSWACLARARSSG